MKLRIVEMDGDRFCEAYGVPMTYATVHKVYVLQALTTQTRGMLWWKKTTEGWTYIDHHQHQSQMERRLDMIVNPDKNTKVIYETK